MWQRRPRSSLHLDLDPKRLDPVARYGVRLTLLAIAILIVGVPFAYLVAQVTSQSPLADFDNDLAATINDTVADSPVLVGISHFLSFLGSPVWFYILITAAVLWFLRRGHVRVVVFLITTNLLGGALNRIVKALVDRPRPEVEDPITEAVGMGFPSGHAMAATFAYGSLVLAFMPFVPRRLRPWIIAGWGAAVLLISLSRLTLGVHFLSDVIGGFLLGLAWLAASVAAFSLWRRDLGKDEVEMLEGAEPEVAGH